VVVVVILIQQNCMFRFARSQRQNCFDFYVALPAIYFKISITFFAYFEILLKHMLH